MPAKRLPAGNWHKTIYIITAKAKDDAVPKKGASYFVFLSINANGDTVFENAVSPFAFLLLQANGMGGQHDLILYGDQADTELL